MLIPRFLMLIGPVAILAACGGGDGPVPLPAVENKVVLAKSNDSYQEVRHIVLRGNNQEIGNAIAALSRADYQAQPQVFESVADKNNRNVYIQQVFPALAERQKGVAQYYGWGDSDLHDSSALWYDITPGACSAIFFPKSTTANGRSLLARNMEFYTVTIEEFMQRPPGKGNKLFSRNFIMEMYPSNGYATLVAGTFDLLNGAFDGFNEHGLMMSGLVDQNIHGIADWRKATGLSFVQMFRAVLEGAKTVEEARQIVSGLKVYFPMDGMHFLIGDRNGNSMVLEFSETDLSPRFMMQPPTAPVIITNHSLFYEPNVASFKKPVDFSKPYDTHYRYLRLHDYLQATVGKKYTPDDGLFAMSMVYGYADDGSEGPALPLPLRTVWSLVMDPDDQSMKIKFYTKDDAALKVPLFTDYYTFKLKR